MRKTTKNFLKEPVSAEVLSSIGTFYSEIPALFPGIETEIGITENKAAGKLLNSLFAVQAPYYLSLYSENRDKCGMNAGYICEQISLYLLTKGLGSCFCGNRPLRGMATTRGSKKLMAVMAFGKPREALTRRHTEAKRLPLNELCAMKDQPHPWMKQVLEAARLAPSQANHQPWRFVIMGNRIHIFSKKQSAERLKKWEEFDFGMMFAHIMIASE
ncbi:MAG: nitroreductase family protein, partial [Lachnospiraceae bacterium]|nr:nitroreductase family protein [Lachnospiraceae bacterium]